MAAKKKTGTTIKDKPKRSKPKPGTPAAKLKKTITKTMEYRPTEQKPKRVDKKKRK